MQEGIPCNELPERDVACPGDCALGLHVIVSAEAYLFDQRVSQPFELQPDRVEG